MKTVSSDQLLANRLGELRFPPELFPPSDLARLEALVENERTTLEAEYQAKLTARVAKVITRKAIAGVIRATPDVMTATPATLTGGAL
jgi:hypothetical protein